jgi:hypothetical protein
MPKRRTPRREAEVETTRAIAELEHHTLRMIFDAAGKDAFERAARTLLFQTSALIAHVRGRERLHELLAAIEAVHPVN